MSDTERKESPLVDEAGEAPPIQHVDDVERGPEEAKPADDETQGSEGEDAAYVPYFNLQYPDPVPSLKQGEEEQANGVSDNRSSDALPRDDLSDGGGGEDLDNIDDDDQDDTDNDLPDIADDESEIDIPIAEEDKEEGDTDTLDEEEDISSLEELAKERVDGDRDAVKGNEEEDDAPRRRRRRTRVHDDADDVVAAADGGDDNEDDEDEHGVDDDDDDDIDEYCSVDEEMVRKAEKVPGISDKVKNMNEFARRGNATSLKALLESMTEEQLDAAYCILFNYSSVDNPLNYAVESGSLECVRLLVEMFEKNEKTRKSGRNAINQRSPENGETALMVAAKLEAVAITAYLMKHGALTEATDYQRRNTLHIACLHENEKVVDALLSDDYGASNTLLSTDTSNNTPIGLAIIRDKVAIAKKMILGARTIEVLYGDYVIDEDPQCDRENVGHEVNGEVEAAEGSDYSEEQSEDSTSEKAKDNISDAETEEFFEYTYDAGKYPNLHLACMHGRLEVVETIFEAEKKLQKTTVANSRLVNTRDCEKKTPLHWALENNHLEIARRCIKEGAIVTKEIGKDKLTYLHLIAEKGDKDIVHSLLEKGAKVNEENVFMEAPLNTAASKANLNVCNALIEKGADLEKKNRSGLTPLLIAANQGHSQLVDALLLKGADVFAKTGKGRSALHLAVLSKDLKTTEVLMQHLSQTNPKALIELVDSSGNAPLHCVAQYGDLEVLKCLAKFKVDLNVHNSNGRTALHLASKHGTTEVAKELIGVNPIMVNCIDQYGDTPLHLAAKYGSDEVIEVLVSEGRANLAARNVNGEHPLHLSSASNERVSTCKLLLELGAEVDCADGSKDSPLQIACRKGASQVVSLLIDWRANVNRRNRWGDTCLDIAIENNATDAALALIRSPEPRWRQALSDVSWDRVERRWETPMRKLIRRMPEVAMEVLRDRCSKKAEKKTKQQTSKPQGGTGNTTLNTTNPTPNTTVNRGNQTKKSNRSDESDSSGSDSRDEEDKDESVKDLNENQEIFTFNYRFIDDEKWMKVKKKKKIGLSKKKWVIDVPGPKDESSYRERRNHCLKVMIDYKREDLISLPLVRSLLREKWRKHGMLFFTLNLLLYIIFLFFLTSYVLSTAFMAPFQYRGLPGYDNLTGSECEKIRAYTSVNGPAAVMSTFSLVCKVFVLILIVPLLIKELIQIVSTPRSYFTTIENYIELFIYLTAILLVVDARGVCYAETGIRLDWQWEVGALCIFWAWINLLLFIRKLPLFGIYVVMFTTILQTFILFFPILLLFIIAFAISFYCLLANQVPFRYEMISIFKIFVMMIGEMDYGDVFDGRADDENKNDPKVQVWYEVVTYIQFAVFLVVMAILIMNLLVGLAVDDISKLTDKSMMQTISMQTEFLLDVELMVNGCRKLKNWCKKCCSSRAKVSPERSSENVDDYDDDDDDDDENYCSVKCCVCPGKCEVEWISGDCTCVFCSEKDQDFREREEILEGIHQVPLQRYRPGGLEARLANLWVLSETAIIEEHYKLEMADQEPNETEAVKKLREQVEQLTTENKELRHDIKTEMAKILEAIAKR